MDRLKVVRFAEASVSISIPWKEQIPFTYHRPSGQHKLTRKDEEYQCEICLKKWNSKSKTQCIGLKVTSLNTNLTTISVAAASNLKLKKVSTPIGCLNYATVIDFSAVTHLLFDRQDFEIAEPNLPTVIESNDLNRLRNLNGLRDLDLYPRPGTAPAACCYPKPLNSEIQTWTLLWAIADCVPGYQSRYVTKTRLMDTYDLSAGWVKKLGEPDLVLENPHYKNTAGIQLYLRERVESFLAERAEEYTIWLASRSKRLEIAREHIAKAAIVKKAQRIQTEQCLRCASSAVLDKGLFCCVHPFGWSDREILCPDWTVKNFTTKL
jgi:hypothetical protein